MTAVAMESKQLARVRARVRISRVWVTGCLSQLQLAVHIQV